MGCRPTRRSFLRLAAAGGLAATGLGASLPAGADDIFDGKIRLIMVTDPGCIFCRKWEREVEAGYRASAEGAFAPLQKFDMRAPELQGISGLAYTPTFVLLRAGREVGRIVGYSGADWFWGEVDVLFRRGGFDPAAPATPAEERRT